MIDYEKLKKADLLACDSENYYFDIEFGKENYIMNLHDSTRAYHDQCIYKTLSIDDLIKRLQKLTEKKQKPLYKDAYYLHNGKIECTCVLNQIGFVFCHKTNINALGREMYDSREHLIDCQVEYWTKLKNESTNRHHELEYDECQHEPDENMYLSNPNKHRCRKCGEFY